MLGPPKPGYWGGKEIAYLTPGVDRYPASQQDTLREASNRDFAGMATRADGSGFNTWPPNRPTPIFVVKVSNDGGSAGGVGSDCSFTYTVTDLYDETLGTTVTPERSRIAETTYLPAGEDDQSEYGIAGWDEDGDLLLIWVDEVPDASTC